MKPRLKNANLSIQLIFLASTVIPIWITMKKNSLVFHKIFSFFPFFPTIKKSYENSKLSTDPKYYQKPLLVLMKRIEFIE